MSLGTTVCPNNGRLKCVNGSKKEQGLRVERDRKKMVLKEKNSIRTDSLSRSPSGMDVVTDPGASRDLVE